MIAGTGGLARIVDEPRHSFREIDPQPVGRTVGVIDGVRTGAAVETVLARSTNRRVVAGVSIEFVGTAATINDIAARASKQGVATAPADEPVIT